MIGSNPWFGHVTCGSTWSVEREIQRQGFCFPLQKRLAPHLVSQNHSEPLDEARETEKAVCQIPVTPNHCL
jgi:hypothetical protein